MFLKRDLFDRWSAIAALAATICTTANSNSSAANAAIDFNRDIRPIFSENCYACHGPDKNKRKADLRLDTKEGLFGKPNDDVIVTPHRLDQSAIYHRITTDDADDVMPPSKTG